MVMCCVPGCGVYDRTSSKSPKYQHVHPNARGRMFKLNTERRKIWSDLLSLEDDVELENQFLCGRHFSLAQYNEVRLSRGCKYNLLLQGAVPDMNIPGLENGAGVVPYQEIELNDDFQLSGSNASSAEPEENSLSNSAQNDCLELTSRANIDEPQTENPINHCETEEPLKHPDVDPVTESVAGGSNISMPMTQDSSANLLVTNIAMQKSKTYDSLCKKIYKNHRFQSYAEKNEYFYARNVSELISRQVLKDVLSALTRDESTIKELTKDKLELLQSREIIKKQKLQLEEAKKEREKCMISLRKHFSKAQLSRILDEKNTNWSQEDFRKAITLIGVSDRAYSITRELLKVPLPARSAVKSLLASIELSEGVLDGVLSFMSAAGNSMTELERQVALCFDEAQLSSRKQITYNTTTDQVQGPHKMMQAAMISGLYSSYSNPVFFKHTCEMTKQILNEIITSLYDAGFNVRVIVCDLGLENQKLFRNLGVDEKTPFFKHPKTKKNLYVWADPPHCEKLLRSHLLDTAIELDPLSPGRQVASRQPLQALISESAHEDLPSHPLRQHHLNVQGSERQRCQLARDVLDSRVADALDAMAGRGNYDDSEVEYFKATAQVCRIGNLFGELFGVSSDLEDGSLSSLFVPAHRLPFGRRQVEQEKMLHTIYETVGKWRVITKKNNIRKELMAFQKGIMMACKGLPLLLKDLQQDFLGQNVHLLTTRLSQDVIERLFGLMRTLFGANQRPDSVEAARRLKSLIMGNNLGLTSKKSNVRIEEALADNVLNILAMRPIRACCMIVEPISSSKDPAGHQSAEPVDEEEDVEDEMNIEEEQADNEESCSDEEPGTDEEDVEGSAENDEVSEDEDETIPIDWTPPDCPQNADYKIALTQIAQSIAGRLGAKMPVLVAQRRQAQRRDCNPSWLPVSLQKRCAPASAFLEGLVSKCDKVFRETNKTSLDKKKGLIARLRMHATKDIPQLPVAVAGSFFLKRVQLRIGTLNTHLWDQRKRKSTKRPQGYQDDKHSRSTNVKAFMQEVDGLADDSSKGDSEA